jgi:hypothetical protein
LFSQFHDTLGDEFHQLIKSSHSNAEDLLKSFFGLFCAFVDCFDNSYKGDGNSYFSAALTHYFPGLPTEEKRLSFVSRFTTSSNSFCFFPPRLILERRKSYESPTSLKSHLPDSTFVFKDDNQPDPFQKSFLLLPVLTVPLVPGLMKYTASYDILRIKKVTRWMPKIWKMSLKRGRIPSLIISCATISLLFSGKQ